jgi:hypothetical protein
VRRAIKLNKPANLAILAMLLLGAISLIASIGYNSSVVAFIGLGLVFWGAILFYIRPEEYTKTVLLEALLSPSLTALYQVILGLGYKGDSTYLPPKYFASPETTKVYISKYKRGKLPTPEQTQLLEKQPFARTRLGILVTPPGIELSKLFEKSLGTSFIKTGLEKLMRDLPKLFIENLEIAENLELQTANDLTQRDDNLASSTQMKSTMIHIRITKPIYGIIFKEAEELSQIASSIGFPVYSAIAIAMTKATGKPVRIVDTRSSEDGNTLEVSYEIMEELV